MKMKLKRSVIKRLMKRRKKIIMKKTPMKSFEIIKEMYEHFVKKSRKKEPKLMICEKEDFNNVETALKEHEAMKQTKFIVAYAKISEEDLKKLINQRWFISNLQPCEIKSLFDEETQKKIKALDVVKEIAKVYDVEFCDKDQTIRFRNKFVLKTIRFKSKEEYDLLREALWQC